MVKPIRRKAKHLRKVKSKMQEPVQHQESIECFREAMKLSLSNRLPLVNRLEELANDPKVKDHSPTTEIGAIHRFFFRRVMNSHYAICALVIHGAVHDAWALLRTMFEFMVSAVYLEAYPEHITRFKGFENIEQYKWAKNLIDASLLDENKLSDWKKLEEAAREWEKQGRGQSYWTGLSFAKTVAACNNKKLSELYMRFYPQASKYVHPSPTGLKRQIDSASNDLEWYPLKDDAPRILDLSILFGTHVLSIYSKCEGLGIQDEIEAINTEERAITPAEKEIGHNCRQE